MANAIVGSGIILSIASLLGVPSNRAGVYPLRVRPWQNAATLFASPQMCLNGVPSIVMELQFTLCS